MIPAMRRHPLRPRKQQTKPAMQAVLSLLKKMGLTDQARRLRITAAWAMAVGPEIAARTEPLSFRRGVLTVRSASAAWQNELTFLKDDIISRVNHVLGDKGSVRELRVVGGTVTPRDNAPEPPPAWVTAQPTAEDLDVARDAGQAIADPELRRVFERTLLLERRRRRIRGT
jgi:predicted nucleic acid-binding Zn ribbon protein